MAEDLLSDSNTKWMRMALQEALLGGGDLGSKDQSATIDSDIPIAALLVQDGELLAKSKNRKEEMRDPTAHAEILAIREAARKLGTWRLDGLVMYTTLEPCPMCAGALVNSRVARIVYGCDDPIAGACGSVFNIVNEKRLNHRIPVVKGVLGDRCSEILKSFFRSRRQASK